MVQAENRQEMKLDDESEDKQYSYDESRGKTLEKHGPLRS